MGSSGARASDCGKQLCATHHLKNLDQGLLKDFTIRKDKFGGDSYVYYDVNLIHNVCMC